jgi:hypothetical protein
MFRAKRHGLGHGTIATACHGFDIHWWRPVSDDESAREVFAPKNDLMNLPITDSLPWSMRG